MVIEKIAGVQPTTPAGRQARMSVRMMSKVWELELPQPLKLLALALADVADDTGGNIYPSKAYMAWKVGAHPKTVQHQLRELEARGIVEVVRLRGHRLASGQWTRLLKLHPERGSISLPPSEKGGAWRTQRGSVGSQKGERSLAPQSVSDPLEIQTDFEIEELDPPRLPGETYGAYLRRTTAGDT